MPNKYLDSVGLAEYTNLVKADLATKAPLASPALTGTPTAPTPTSDNDSTQIATTEFVQNIKDDEVTRADGKYLPLAGGTLTGVVNGVTPTAGDDSTKLATTAFVNAKTGNYLPLSGGTMTGAITLETAYALKRNVDSSSLIIFGGTANNRGAYLNLSGKDSSYAAHFNLVAHDGTRTGVLDGSPDGTLKWGGHNVITSALTGTILSASGSFSTVQTITTACQITEHAAGTWLIIGYGDLSSGDNDIYATYIYAAGRSLRYTRNYGKNGGGNVNVVIATLAENEPVIFKGYLATVDMGNFRGKLQMVQLA